MKNGNHFFSKATKSNWFSLKTSKVVRPDGTRRADHREKRFLVHERLFIAVEEFGVHQSLEEAGPHGPGLRGDQHGHFFVRRMR